MRRKTVQALVMALAAATALSAKAQGPAGGGTSAGSDEAAELAKKLANPVASLISVPLQYNYDENFGADDKGSKSVLNIQPVIPFSLSEDWNLITRTIIPLVDQQDIPPGSDKSGLGDILQSFFFSPKQWSVPMNATVSQLLKAGPQILQLTAGVRYWAEAPDNGPEDVGFRAGVTFLFPK
jgi:hypothetical protein